MAKQIRDGELMFWGTILVLIFVPLGIFMMYLAESRGMSFHIFEIIIVVIGIFGGIFNLLFGSGLFKLGDK
jgi:hypothetical protein